MTLYPPLISQPIKQSIQSLGLMLAAAAVIGPAWGMRAAASPLDAATLAQTPAPTTPVPATPAPTTPPARTAPASLQPGDIPLYLRPSFVNTCRRTNRTVEVFSEPTLNPVNRVGTLTPNTQVTLTGVLDTGRAQVYRRDGAGITVVGWVNAAFLTSCDAPIPTTNARYQILFNGLTVRSNPSVGASIRGTLPAGAIVCATTNPPREETSPNAPPNFGRIWAEISFQGSPGWISRTGENGLGANAIRLADAPCP
ncbi:MAG: hypothetical protein IGS50_07455 [Synechococcales cyanobacterium C42_A2020_086]|nr:hypothetical protein [Synechococcales cyanobacterium C42_A2020_086]